MDALYPPDVVLQMDDDHPGILVPDLVRNIFRFCIVSGKLKALLEEHSHATIEFLPASVANHKGRRVGECFIANVMGVLDCVDWQRSDLAVSKEEPDVIQIIRRLHLQDDRIPVDAKFFRLKPKPSVLIIRDDLRTTLESNGISGVRYVAMGEPHKIY